MSRYQHNEAHVYELVDPRNDEAFYIGKTVQPTGRYSQHFHNSAGACYHRMREIRATGQQTIMRIVATFRSEVEALNYEHQLIQSSPKTLNRTRGHGRYELDTPGLYWGAGDLAYVPWDGFDRPEPEPCDP